MSRKEEEQDFCHLCERMRKDFVSCSACGVSGCRTCAKPKMMKCDKCKKMYCEDGFPFGNCWMENWFCCCTCGEAYCKDHAVRCKQCHNLYCCDCDFCPVCG